MILPYALSSAKDRSAGELMSIPGASGAWVSFVGAVPGDLTVTFVPDQGGTLVENIPVNAGDNMQVSFRQMVLTHAPVPNGAGFTVVLSSGTDRYEASPRAVQMMLRTGQSATALVPQRQPTGIVAVNAIDATIVQQTTLVAAQAGKQIRLLRYRFVLEGAMTFAAVGHGAIALTDGGTNYVPHNFGKQTTAAPGELLDTGVVDLGDGIQMPVGAGIAVNWFQAATAGFVAVYVWYSYDI